MNPICQDRILTVAPLHLACIALREPASFRKRRVLSKASTAHDWLLITGKNQQEQVGKTFANWNPKFANWIQLAKPCQLNSYINHSVKSLLASWQVGKPIFLPTEISCCYQTNISTYFVGENSPSYYVGEGIQIPSPLRKEVASGLRVSEVVWGRSILAIDLGTITGWALRTRDGSMTSGIQSFRPQRFEGGGMRYLRFRRWLAEIRTAAEEIHAVYFEEVRRHIGVDAAHVYGGLMATLTAWCEHHNIPYQGVPVGTIKKHATGRGNASKEEVMAAMRALGHHPADDNEADALALLYWALETQEC